MKAVDAHKKSVKVLLICGICGSLLYPITDIIAGNLYEGYSFNEQAVSELFAIGAPTSQMVVALFTLSSILFIAFAVGVYLSSHGRRMLSVMIFGHAVNSLILWNFFPMRMRGAQPSFTDAMQGILAINPFILISIILGAIYFRNWFRYSFSLQTWPSNEQLRGRVQMRFETSSLSRGFVNLSTKREWILLDNGLRDKMKNKSTNAPTTQCKR